MKLELLIAFSLIAFCAKQSIAAAGEICLYDVSKISFQALLGNAPTISRKKFAYLAVDANGRPSLFPSPRTDSKTNRLNDLSNMSPSDIKAIWQPLSTGHGKGFDFFGWDGKWQTWHVDLKFVDGKCSNFRVLGPHVPISSWLPTKNIPEFGSFTPKGMTTKLALPWYVAIPDGPRDGQCHMMDFDPL